MVGTRCGSNGPWRDANERSGASEGSPRGDAPRISRMRMTSSHAADLELARLCAAGDERAWETFVREYRPLLYRAADALDRTRRRARARRLALRRALRRSRQAPAERQSLFRYFEGRSSLATWLRAVLAQRYVDRAARRAADRAACRRGRRPQAAPPADPDRDRYVALVRAALARARVAARPARSPASRRLLRAGSDAGAARPAAARERGVRVAPPRAHAPRRSAPTSSVSCARSRD